MDMTKETLEREQEQLLRAAAAAAALREAEAQQVREVDRAEETQTEDDSKQKSLQGDQSIIKIGNKYYRRFKYLEDGVKKFSTLLLGPSELVSFRNKMLECSEEWEESEGRSYQNYTYYVGDEPRCERVPKVNQSMLDGDRTTSLIGEPGQKADVARKSQTRSRITEERQTFEQPSHQGQSLFVKTNLFPSLAEIRGEVPKKGCTMDRRISIDEQDIMPPPQSPSVRAKSATPLRSYAKSPAQPKSPSYSNNPKSPSPFYTPKSSASQLRSCANLLQQAAPAPSPPAWGPGTSPGLSSPVITPYHLFSPASQECFGNQGRPKYQNVLDYHPPPSVGSVVDLDQVAPTSPSQGELVDEEYEQLPTTISNLTQHQAFSSSKATKETGRPVSHTAIAETPSGNKQQDNEAIEARQESIFDEELAVSVAEPAELSEHENSEEPKGRSVIKPTAQISMRKGNQGCNGAWRFTAQLPEELFTPKVRVVLPRDSSKLNPSLKPEDEIVIEVKEVQIKKKKVRVGNNKKKKPKEALSHLPKSWKLDVTEKTEPIVKQVNYRCGPCGKICNSLKIVKEHLCLPRLQCIDCHLETGETVTLPTRAFLLEHLNVSHPNLSIQCSQCEKKFPSQTLLKGHMKVHMIEQKKRAKAVLIANAASASQNESFSYAYDKDKEVVKKRSESLKVINAVEPPLEVRDEFDDTMCSTKPLEDLHKTRVQSEEESDETELEEAINDQFVNLCTELSKMEQETEIQSEEETYETEMEKIREDHIERLRTESSGMEQGPNVQSEEESDENEMEETTEGQFDRLCTELSRMEQSEDESNETEMEETRDDQFARLCTELSRMEEEAPDSPPRPRVTASLIPPQPSAQAHLSFEAPGLIQKIIAPLSTTVSSMPKQSSVTNSHSAEEKITSFASANSAVQRTHSAAVPSTPITTPVSSTSKLTSISDSSPPSNQQTSISASYVCKKCHKTFVTPLRHKNHSLKCGLAVGQTVKLEPGLRKVKSLKKKNTRLKEMSVNWKEALESRERCCKCGRNNYREDDMEKHQRVCRGTLQGGETKHPCPYCTKPARNFVSDVSLRGHIVNEHSQEVSKASRGRGLAYHHLFRD